MKTYSSGQNIADRIAAVLVGAGVGAIAWLVAVFFFRWVLLLLLVFFGISWFPTFFGWGTIVFASAGAIIGWIVADV